VLHRNLTERAPASDLFGVKGRCWLADLALPTDEEETVLACLGQLDFLGEELRRPDEVIAKEALTSEDIRRLLTVPGVNLATAAPFMAAVGDIRRFRTPQVPGQLPPSGLKRPTVRPVLHATAASPSRALPALATPWSNPPGSSPVLLGPYTPLASEFGLVAGPMSPLSPLPASWPCCSGTC
jgi:hypothetical protein